MRNRQVEERSPMTGWVELIEHRENEILQAYVCNISRSGLGLYATKPLHPGTDVDMNLHFLGPAGFETVQGLRGTVAWTFEHSGYIAIGIQFSQPINEKAYPDLFVFLESPSQRPSAKRKSPA